MSNPLLDPFLISYNPTELRTASEFLTTWLPFLSKDLCGHCTQILSRRVRSLELRESDRAVEAAPEASFANNESGSDQNDDRDSHSLGSWKDGNPGEVDGPLVERGCDHSSALPRERYSKASHEMMETQCNRISWADMAQEEDRNGEEEGKACNQLLDENHSKADIEVEPPKQKPELSREQRESIRFNNVTRKKDFVCLERVDGRVVNILEGLELHTGIFSAKEQRRIVDFVYQLQEMGKNGQLRERTYSAPAKWMRGKGRQTIQFGCCYNYARDKDGNPPGIIKNNLLVDPLPHLFKEIIKRLVRWLVLPTTCIPDSCIVNIYEEGDCIPPHIDNHDFVRPFCTVSFLSECKILFGSNLNIVGPGEFSGSFAIPLPVGSVLVLNGNGADVAKHCVPAVPTKRISITFRRMDESKRPIGFVPEPDLQNIELLQYEVDKPEQLSPQTPEPLPTVRKLGRSHPHSTTQSDRTEIRTSGANGHSFRGGSPHSEPRFSGSRYQTGQHTSGRS